MIMFERLEKISTLLREKGTVEVLELSTQLGVSPKTIRIDLTKLEELGVAERVYGGAKLKETTDVPVMPTVNRESSQRNEKRMIAEAAYAMIEENDTVILAPGSTTTELSRLLGDKHLVVLTNDVRIAYELYHKVNIQLVLIGGTMARGRAFTIWDRKVEDYVRQYNVNKIFVGATAIDAQKGFMDVSTEAALMKPVLMAVASKVICLADYSKFTNMALFTFCKPSEVDLIITDSRITPEKITEFARIGVKILVAKDQ